MINFSKFNSICALAIYFNTEGKCKQAIAEYRWRDGDVVCPYCGAHHCHTRADGRYRCPNCKGNFSVTVGTIFENTKIPLRKWFMAMYLISCHKKGISSCQLAVDIAVTQKTAWFILHKIRSLFAQDDSVALEDEVECDELFLGGRETNKHASKKTEHTQGRSLKTKTPIFGMAEREGRVVSMVVPDTKSATLLPIIKQFVADNAHIFTDDCNAYGNLTKEGYKHSIIKHSIKEYVEGDVTTNTIEGFWGHFKRTIFGTYHFVSRKYLQRYVDEAVYRYNTSGIAECGRFFDMFSKSIGKFDYLDVRMERIG